MFVAPPVKKGLELVVYIRTTAQACMAIVGKATGIPDSGAHKAPRDFIRFWCCLQHISRVFAALQD